MSRVTISTDVVRAFSIKRTPESLTKYLQRTVMEKTDPQHGVVEQLQENVEYLSGIVARLLEAQILGGVNFRDPAVVDYLIFGSNTNHIKEVTILKDGQDDDIPF